MFDNDYDAGFLNVPGYGQSVTNPLSPVFYDSLGVVNDLSVYQSMYAAKTINAGVSFIVGKSSLSVEGMNIGVPSSFQKDVRVKGVTSTEKLVVNGKEYVERTIKADNGTFRVLARP
jgi:hypothetical protein